MLQSMGSQRVRHALVTEQQQTILVPEVLVIYLHFLLDYKLFQVELVDKRSSSFKNKNAFCLIVFQKLVSTVGEICCPMLLYDL